MTITDRNAIREGMTLTANYKGETHEVLVLADEQGRLAFEYRNQIFKSPSSAGSAIMGGIACNGWRFFSIAGEAPDKPVTTRAPRAKKEPILPERRKRAITKVPNQRGTEEGQTRWWCSGCCASFYADGDVLPDACPTGHPAYIDDVEASG